MVFEEKESSFETEEETEGTFEAEGSGFGVDSM